MDVRNLQPPGNAEAQMEQRPSGQCRSEATGFEEARVEGRLAGERCHEFARLVVSLPFSFASKTSPSQSKLVFLNARTGD